MIKKEKNDVHWLEFELLQGQPLKHAVLLRHGGVSEAPFNSLNLSASVGDSQENVDQNLNLVKDTLGISNLVFAKQVHQKEIADVKLAIPLTNTCDALTTANSGISLVITHADCQAAIIYDPKKHAVTNIHSGWRGSVQNIYAEAIRTMQKRFGSNPHDLLVCISPSLGPEDAEFKNYREELPQEFWKYQVKDFYFDFWEISKMQLVKEGVLPEYIEVAKISTYAHPEDYFSYRRDRVTGRHGTIVSLF